MKHCLIICLLSVVVQGHSIRHPSSLANEQHAFPALDNEPAHGAESRIVSGAVATHGQFPYQAALYYNTLFRAGSLISRRWVLTCGNGAAGKTSVTVHLGAQNLNNVNTEAGRLIIQTSKILLHYAFNIPQAANNIALIDLGFDIPLNDFIKPIGIASGSNQYVDYPGRVSGWGKEIASGETSAELKYTDLTIISNEVCSKIYSGIIASKACAKGPANGGVCNGDSGGPLVDLVSGRQFGIVIAWSGSGCESDRPSVYTRVSYFAPWITANTGIIP